METLSIKEIQNKIRELTAKEQLKDKGELKQFLVERAYNKGFEKGKEEANIRYVVVENPEDAYDFYTAHDWVIKDLEDELYETERENERLRDLLAANVKVLKAEIKKELEEDGNDISSKQDDKRTIQSNNKT